MKRYQKRAHNYMMRWNVRVHKRSHFTIQQEIEKTWAAGYRAAIRDVLKKAYQPNDPELIVDYAARCVLEIDIKRLVEE